MDREKFIEKKQLEIQEEVDFLREEKTSAHRESSFLYEHIIDKIEKLKQYVIKEELANKRLMSIEESGAQTYGVYTGSPLHTPYSINRSLVRLDSLAKSKFDIEEFGGLLEEKEKEKPSIEALQWNGDNYVEVTNFILENIGKSIKCFTHNDKTVIVNLYNGQGLIINCGDFIFKKESNILTMPENIFKKKYKIKSVEYIVKENV